MDPESLVMDEDRGLSSMVISLMETESVGY